MCSGDVIPKQGNDLAIPCQFSFAFTSVPTAQNSAQREIAMKTDAHSSEVKMRDASPSNFIAEITHTKRFI